MATIPPNSMLAAQRCRRLHHQRQLMRSISEPISTGTSPICTPESTPPASPRKFDFLPGNPLAKLNQMLQRSMTIDSGVVGVGVGNNNGDPSKLTKLVHPTVASETEVGASASGLTQSLEASHHTSSITSMT